MAPFKNPSLLTLMSTLIYGKVNVEETCSQAVLTISGLITYSTTELGMTSSHRLSHRHHNKERETSATILLD